MPEYICKHLLCDDYTSMPYCGYIGATCENEGWCEACYGKEPHMCKGYEPSDEEL